MPGDFLLEPDDLEEPDRPERRRPPRIVSTGLAPTAEVPTMTRGTPDLPPAYPALSRLWRARAHRPDHERRGAGDGDGEGMLCRHVAQPRATPHAA